MNRLSPGVALDAAMYRLAAQHLEEQASPEIARQLEKRAMAEFDRAQRRKHARVWIAAAAVAASLAAIIVETRPAHPPVDLLVDSEDQPFTPIPYVLPPSPDERVEVVRMKMPVAALVAAGLPLRTADPGAEAEADVIVGQDGRPRAVRLISISSFN